MPFVLFISQNMFQKIVLSYLSHHSLYLQNVLENLTMPGSCLHFWLSPWIKSREKYEVFFSETLNFIYHSMTNSFLKLNKLFFFFFISTFQNPDSSLLWCAKSFLWEFYVFLVDENKYFLLDCNSDTYK